MKNSRKRADQTVIGLKKEIEKGIGLESLFKGITSENLLNLEKDINTEVQEHYRTPFADDMILYLEKP